jgi:hypothetical protein
MSNLASTTISSLSSTTIPWVSHTQVWWFHFTSFMGEIYSGFLLLSENAQAAVVAGVFTLLVGVLIERHKYNYEIFKNHLGLLSTFSRKKYIPYITQTDNLRNSLEKIISCEKVPIITQEDYLKIYFILAQWVVFRHEWYKNDKVYYLILKSHSAEKLITHFLEQQGVFIRKTFFTADSYSRFVDNLKRDETWRSFHVFSNLPIKNQEQKKIFDDFVASANSIRMKGTKIQELKHFIETLDVFCKIFESEIFNCNQAWYTKVYFPPTFLPEQHEIIFKNLREIFDNGWIRRREANYFLSRIKSQYRIGLFKKQIFTKNPIHFARYKAILLMKKHCSK